MKSKKWMATSAALVVVCATGITAFYIARHGAATQSNTVDYSPAVTPNATRADNADVDPVVSSRSLTNSTAHTGSAEVLRADPRDDARLDELNLSQNLDALTSEARRNPRFAYALAMALNECMHFSESFSAIDSAVTNGALNPDQAEAALDNAETRYRKCSGLTSANAELQYELATKSARAGVLDAQINYPTLAASFALSDLISPIVQP